jgi:hypothetical protein
MSFFQIITGVDRHVSAHVMSGVCVRVSQVIGVERQSKVLRTRLNYISLKGSIHIKDQHDSSISN